MNECPVCQVGLTGDQNKCPTCETDLRTLKSMAALPETVSEIAAEALKNNDYPTAQAFFRLALALDPDNDGAREGEARLREAVAGPAGIAESLRGFLPFILSMAAVLVFGLVFYIFLEPPVRPDRARGADGIELLSDYLRAGDQKGVWGMDSGGRVETGPKP